MDRHYLQLIPMQKLPKHVIFDCDGTLIDTNLPKYKLFPGIKELIQELSKDCLLYVWTARGRSSTLRILEELGVHQYFDSFSTIDDTIPKPHIAGLVDLVGRTPKEAICVIGDSSNDMIGAKNFGVLALGAIWNNGASSQVLKDAGADFIVNHPSECSKLILEKLIGADHV
jgi:phosphoglycolate phosphatase-like HAD superfamily hydrolase